MGSAVILDSQPYFIAAILQSFFYAFYLVSLVHAIRWLLYEEGWTLKSRDTVNWPLLMIALLIFAFATADIVFEVLLQLTSSISINSEGTHLFLIASVTVECISLMITDAVLIIRCWLVYRKSLPVVCFPIMLWLANIATLIIWITVYTITLAKGKQHSPVSMFSLKLFYCFNSTTNIYATGAIVYRLQRVARETSNGSSILYRICRTVAATGGLYALTSLPLAVTAFYIPDNTTPYLICDAINFSTAGITFNFLLIRVGQIRAEVAVDNDQSSRHVSSGVLFSTHLGVPTIPTTNFSIDSGNGNIHPRIQTNPNPLDSALDNK